MSLTSPLPFLGLLGLRPYQLPGACASPTHAPQPATAGGNAPHQPIPLFGLTWSAPVSAPRCASQPAHCRSQLTSSDSRSAMVSRPSSSVSSPESGCSGCWPARCPQFAERGVQRVQVGGGQELVHPGG